jgi:DNA damage-binding protein 2
VDQKDETKIIVCGRAEKKRSRKSGNKSDDDSDDDKFTSKDSKLKSNKPEWKLTRCSNKVKR